MTTTYLLPCSCGRRIPIEPRQAGEAIQCDCGQVILAPPMSKITALVRCEAARPGEAQSTSWGWSQRWIFAGAALIVLSAVGAIAVYRNRPVNPFRPPDPQTVQREIQKLSPLESVRQFRALTNSGIETQKWPAELAYERAMVRHWAWLGLLAVAGGAGLGLVVFGWARMAWRSRAGRICRRGPAGSEG